MNIIVDLLQTVFIAIVDWLPFIEDGQAFWDTLSTWVLRGAIGGGIASYPFYQIMIARYSLRVAKRIIRKIVRLLIIIGIIALAVKYLMV